MNPPKLPDFALFHCEILRSSVQYQKCLYVYVVNPTAQYVWPLKNVLVKPYHAVLRRYCSRCFHENFVNSNYFSTVDYVRG